MHTIWKKYLIALLGVVLLALLVRIFVVSFYRVSSHSMSPTLEMGDFVFVSQWGGAQDIKRGALVIYRSERDSDRMVVRRVIGLPGDKIEIQNGQVILNDQPQKEFANISSPEVKNFNREPIVVVPDEVFLMPDNRTFFTDEGMGPVPSSRVFLVIIAIPRHL